MLWEEDLAADDIREEKLALTCSRDFPQWLASTHGALAFTTYQAGKLFFVGTTGEAKLSIFERTFARSMVFPEDHQQEECILIHAEQIIDLVDFENDATCSAKPVVAFQLLLPSASGGPQNFCCRQR